MTEMRMPRITWQFGRLWSNFKDRIAKNIALCKLTRKSLFYNSFTSFSTVLDTLMEPLFWFVDHTVRYLGPLFVLLVVALTLSVVVIFYICLLPQVYEESFTWTCIHLLFGHYFLVCIVFYYFKAAFTDPGKPPEIIEEVVSICKRCIAPKPPRSHHCSICKKCVLKMDHHCPWLNNCVGHNNHRYFLLFCLYMWIGTVYVSASAYPLFKVHFYGVEDPGPSGFLYPFYLLKKHLTFSKSNTSPVVETNEADHHSDGVEQHAEVEVVKPTRDTAQLTFHHLIIYEFLLCSAVSFALGILLLWHCRLISYGETSIEWHINRREASRLKQKGQIYKSPYDFGFIRNWQKFLGIHRTGRFWTRVLLPSSHSPEEDGIRWTTTTYTIDHGLLLL